MAKCNHKNKQFTWQREQIILTCILDKGHPVGDGSYHKGFAPKQGMAVSDPSLFPEDEFIVVDGISYRVEEQLVSWGDEESKDLKHPEKEK